MVCEGYAGHDFHGQGTSRCVLRGGSRWAKGKALMAKALAGGCGRAVDGGDPGGKRCQGYAGQDRIAKALAGGPGRVAREGSMEAKCDCGV